KQFSYFRIGNPNDVVTSTTAGTVLMGGSTDVDAAFQWLCDRSAGGDFLVIRATGTDAYNPYVQDLCPTFNSVATLIIPSISAANDPFVAATIRSAEVLWIAGGDQSNYINFWKGTPVQAAVNELIARGVPVGGTSAGFNVLPQFIFAAQNGTETSSQALADCLDPPHQPRSRFRQYRHSGRHYRRPPLCRPRPHGPLAGLHGAHHSGRYGAFGARHCRGREDSAAD